MPTALITGASSGIGAEFARRYAAKGFDLVLAARRTDRMQALADELSATHGTTIKVLSADLAKPGSALALANQIDGEIDVLINNSGFGHIGPFDRENIDSIADEINVNVAALTQLSRIYFPMMKARGQGAIINIASTASYQPIPNMSVYGATKAYVLNFTEALWGEAQGTGVKILAVSPGPTETEFFNIAEGHTLDKKILKASDVVDAAFEGLAANHKRPSVIVGGKNSVMAGLARIAPKRVVIAVAKKMLRSNLDLLEKNQ
jgi:short-subunit dehydrogenase